MNDPFSTGLSIQGEHSVTGKLKSRKLWVAVIGAAVVAFAHQMGIDQHSAQRVVDVLAAYLIAQGAHDAAGAYSASSVPPSAPEGV